MLEFMLVYSGQMYCVSFPYVIIPLHFHTEVKPERFHISSPSRSWSFFDYDLL